MEDRIDVSRTVQLLNSLHQKVTEVSAVYAMRTLSWCIRVQITSDVSTVERDGLIISIHSLVAKLLSANRLSPLPGQIRIQLTLLCNDSVIPLDEAVQAALNLLTRQSMLDQDVGTADTTELKYVCQGT